jgi:hypothetical protein
MSKDMLALMGQGAESQVGDMSSLQTKRQEETSEQLIDSAEVNWNTDRNMASMVVLVMEQDEKKLNQLLYDVALFNFSQFMIKDFDLKQNLNFGKDQCAVIVSGFEKMDEAEWYHNLLTQNPEISQSITTNNIQIICITPANFDLIGKHFTLTDYLQWLKENN